MLNAVPDIVSVGWAAALPVIISVGIGGGPRRGPAVRDHTLIAVDVNHVQQYLREYTHPALHLGFQTRTAEAAPKSRPKHISP